MAAHGSGDMAAVGRKRKLLTFSELTDAFVEGEVKCEKDAWILAKQREEAGDYTLWNTLGDARCVSCLLAKVRRAWACERMPAGTLITQVRFNLGNFLPVDVVDKRLVHWMHQGHAEVALILCGLGGLGKTKFACALMLALSRSESFHFLNKLDHLRDIAITPLSLMRTCMHGSLSSADQKTQRPKALRRASVHHRKCFALVHFPLSSHFFLFSASSPSWISLSPLSSVIRSSLLLFFSFDLRASSTVLITSSFFVIRVVMKSSAMISFVRMLRFSSSAAEYQDEPAQALAHLSSHHFLFLLYFLHLLGPPFL